MDPDPIVEFARWYAEAAPAEPNEPDAVNLATVDAEGRPRSRMVLLKGFGKDGFRFFTNRESDKGIELARCSAAALCFYWKGVRRQIRVEGAAVRLSVSEDDAYFARRARGSQIGAWASDQSRLVASRRELLARILGVEEQYEGRAVPRPPHWGGYRLVARRIEFWQGRCDRLHDRWRYERVDDAWRRIRLQP